MNHFRFMEIDDHVDFLYLNCLLHYINVIIMDITFSNHLCLCCGNCDGSFKVHTEFMHINNVLCSWKRTYILHLMFHKKNYGYCMGFFCNSPPNLFMKVQGNLKEFNHNFKSSNEISWIKWNTKWMHHNSKWLKTHD
jgi:hypothetical protein